MVKLSAKALVEEGHEKIGQNVIGHKEGLSVSSLYEGEDAIKLNTDFKAFVKWREANQTAKKGDLNFICRKSVKKMMNNLERLMSSVQKSE